jgi:hypothetical protein
MGIIREHVDIGGIPAVIRALDLWEPPTMLCHDYPGIYSGIKLRSLFSVSPRRFQPDPVPLQDTVLSRRIGMDLNDRIGPDLPQPWQLRQTFLTFLTSSIQVCYFFCHRDVQG